MTHYKEVEPFSARRTAFVLILVVLVIGLLNGLLGVD